MPHLPAADNQTPLVTQNDVGVGLDSAIRADALLLRRWHHDRDLDLAIVVFS